MIWGTPLDYEYLKAANPEMPAVPIQSFPGDLHRQGPTRVIDFDNAKDLQTPYPATSPNCLVSYLRICTGESLTTTIQATLHLLYVLRAQPSHSSYIFMEAAHEPLRGLSSNPSTRLP